MSKYLNIPVLPDIIFVVFLVSWFITRQVLLLQIIWDVTFECPRILPLVWDPAQGLYFSRGLWTVITIGLWALYVLLCSWFWLGCKVAYNVVRGQAVQDVRSDDEDE
jgi:acyl-CoA-dependent ceramide synthase